MSNERASNSWKVVSALTFRGKHQAQKRSPLLLHSCRVHLSGGAERLQQPELMFATCSPGRRLVFLVYLNYAIT